mgnify:CR=1 FL=1
MTTLYANGRLDTPSGLKVAPQSYASLEQVAADLQKILPLARGERYRLDCWKVLEQTLQKAGLQLKVVELEDLDECAAFTIPERGVVVFREDIYEMVLSEHVFGRSTVIHETSHIVLKHAVTLHRGAKLGEHRFCEDSEWQAKALTAATMMPLAACKNARSPEDLAEMCGTSVQAASYRLGRLTKDGLITRQKSFWEVT